MEAVMMHGSVDQSISPNKSHFKNRKITHHNPFVSNPPYLNSTGHVQPQPSPFLSQSYPPYKLRQTLQPPLLPLPANAPRRSSAAPGLACPPANQKTGNRNKARRDPSLSPNKSKSPGKVEKNSPRKLTYGNRIIGSDERKLKNDSSLISSGSRDGGDDMDIFSGSLAIAPPPSSLPLPTLWMRGCKAEAAAGIDAGATDDLRRLLRLQ